MPRNLQRRTEVIAFRGMIVDDVEHDLDAGVMKSGDRHAEFVQRGVRGVALLRREEPRWNCIPSSCSACARPVGDHRRSHGSAEARSW